MLLSPIVLYHLMSAILFACCYITGWGKFGRVFCKQTSVAACRFQNECNKVVIALRVVQFWSEIKLVITNRSPASRSCDFVNHAFDFSPNCTPLSAITIINLCCTKAQNESNDLRYL